MNCLNYRVIEGSGTKLTGPADARKVDRRSPSLTKSDASLQYVLQMHGKSTDVDKRFCGCNFFTVDPVGPRKVDGS